uniref:Protein toll n=2 Tax=Cacopsylla melanoneura TaxID=428564 RepID=A0A8D8R7C9_9HEMI
MHSRTLVSLLLAILLHFKQKSAFELGTNCRNCFYSSETVNRDLVYIPELDATLEVNSKRATDYFQRPVGQMKEEIRFFEELNFKTLCFSKAKHPELNGYTSNFISDYFENPIAYPEFNTFPHIKLSMIERKYGKYVTYSERTLDIDCTHFGLTDTSTLNTSLYDLIPTLNLVHIKELSLKFCPFPDEPFQTLFSIVNVTEILSLKISDSPNKFNLSIPWNYKLDKMELINNTGLTRVDADLSQVSLLRLRRKEISSLDHDMFKQLGNLETLNMGETNISDSDLVSFQHLKNLRTLKLDNNRLVSPPSALFSNISNLYSLDMSNNNMSTLHTGEFKELTQLNYLNMRGNKLTTLEPGVFQHLTKLERLYLDHNNISELDPDIFQNLTSLKELKMNNNQLVSLSGALFNNVTNLISLDVSGNHISVLSQELFQACGKLSQLDLSHNKLEHLKENQFEFLENLEALNLSNNQLETITHGMFNGTHNIMTLDLSHNKLKSISEPEFDPCKNNKYALHSIDLSHNILELDSHLEHSPFNECKELQTLKLSNNRINKIYKDWILNMPSLATLDLKSNNITMMPNYDYGDYNNLFRSSKMILDISYNQIEVIEWRFLKLLSQRRKNKIFRNKIVLNGNPIACNCSNYDLLSAIQNLTIDKVAVLQKIAIETQNVTCKPGNISIDRVHPREITCSPVEGCPSSCHCIHAPYHNETTVNCSSAKLKQIPPELNMTYEGKIASKIRLILTNNSIQELPQNSPDMYKIVTDLDLSFNEISHWETDNLFHLLRLKQLNISHNRLGSLNQDVINLLSSSNISSLSLSGNPWACDCDNITRLYNFVWTKQFIIKDSKQITCNGEAKPLLEVNRNNLCSSNKHQQIVVTSIIMGSLGILFGLLVLLYYKYQNEIKVWLFAHGLLQWCVSQEDIDTDKVYDAFVSYASEDYGFVVHSLLPELDNSFRICHHERDFIGGEWIHIQIEEKVQQSRRTIIVLTEEFLNSYWGMTEFRVAYAQSLKDNCARIIILILRDMPPQDAIPDEMKLYMSMNTYIKWGDKWFWDKLKYALPHPPARPSREFPMVEFND